MTKTILVVEDEADIADVVLTRLRNDGFDAEWCADGSEAVKRCADLRPDLVVLDLLLPGLGGLEVCRQIQLHRRTPVVMLTAKDDETDLLVGLGVGADDYITKPFSPRELVARVHAVLRRTADAPPSRDRLIVGDVVLDESTRTVERARAPVHLTPTEFDVLHSLTIADGAVLTRAQLLSRVWGYRDGSGARTVDSHVRSVRRKLGDNVIRTVHGVGYAIGLGEDIEQ